MLFLLWLGALGGAPAADAYFRIQVVDSATGRGVPLVELRTVNQVRYYTDSNGLVAFDEPGLMGRTVYFHVRSHGYEFPKDGFGYRGKRLKVVAGDRATLKISRINVAQRIYRVTGAGIYRDTIRLGEKPPLAQPLLNGEVFGSDSVVNVLYGGKIYWFWGDTNRPSYPLGNFHVPGATSLPPAAGGLDPDVGIDLNYIVDDSGFARPTCQMPGPGPTWIDALVTLDDEGGRQRLFAKYVKVQPPLKVYQRGIVVFNDESQRFDKRRQLDAKTHVYPAGHPFKHSVDGVEYVYFPKPFPVVRVRANPLDFEDPARYETFTCLRSGSRRDNLQLDRDEQGQLRYAWRKDTAPLTPKLEAQLIEQGRLRADEARWRLKDADSDKTVAVHSSSVAWNEYRGTWVMIALEAFGSSPLGEIWFAEAKQPTGPWSRGRKIVTHERYSFYNPKQHPALAKQRGRIVFFEGTYTTMFSGNSAATPRYDYNQVMYKLDLADPRLAPSTLEGSNGAESPK